MVVPDGPGYRNFVLGRMTSFLSGRLTLQHGFPTKLVDPASDRLAEQPGPEIETRHEPLPQFFEGATVRILREAKSLSQLYRRRDEDEGALQLERLRAVGSSLGLRHRTAMSMARAIARSTRSLNALDDALDSAVARTRACRAMTERLRVLAPDAVFCTHQRASSAMPTMVAARRLGIPTATFVYSWDNLAKGRMPIRADWYFLWGPQMLREFETYFPEFVETHPDRVVQTGTPQFDPHFEKKRIVSRRDFLTRLGLDPARPVVLFSGDDLSTSPRDPDLLRDLAEGLRRESTRLPAQERPQLIFRRCPADLSERYREVLDDHPDIVELRPLWRHLEGDWRGALPTQDDVTLLANLVHNCDLVVNLGSTMALDFALFDKPAVFIAYEPGPSPLPWSTSKIYRLPHFRLVHDLAPVHWARSREELGPVVVDCLRQPGALGEARRRWIHALCGPHVEGAGERCALALEAIARSRKAPVAKERNR